MRRPVLPTGRFVRAVKRLAKRDPVATHAVRVVVEMLAEDAFQPLLDSHKLKGDKAGCWACSAGFDLRVVFEVVREAGVESILLLSVGSHEDVY